MDLLTHKECLRLIGQICVQYGLPAGDPCWIAANIGSYIESPLEEAIYKYRLLRAQRDDRIRAWESLIRPYNGFPHNERVEILNHPILKAKITAIDKEIRKNYPSIQEAARVVTSYFTTANRLDIERRCYEK